MPSTCTIFFIQLTGVMTVKSGRWLPPAEGWLLKMTSPSCRVGPCFS